MTCVRIFITCIAYKFFKQSKISKEIIEKEGQYCDIRFCIKISD